MSDFGVMSVELGSNVTFLVRMRVSKVNSNSTVEFWLSAILGMGGCGGCEVNEGPKAAFGDEGSRMGSR